MTHPTCVICHRPVPDYEPIGCCGGTECGCMGQATNPCLCSAECDTAFGMGIGTSYELRRIAAGILVWESGE